jgi:hypothetical protein
LETLEQVLPFQESPHLYRPCHSRLTLTLRGTDKSQRLQKNLIWVRTAEWVGRAPFSHIPKHCEREQM